MQAALSRSPLRIERRWLEGEDWGEGIGRNILGNVLYGVLSFSSWFSCSFIYFSLFFFFLGTHLMPFVLLIDIHIYKHIWYINRYVCVCVCKPEAAVKWEWVSFFLFFNAFLVERKLKQFECTLSAPKLMRFHARHRTNLSYLEVSNSRV